MEYTQSQLTAIEHILLKKVTNIRKERNELHEKRIEEGIYSRTDREQVLTHQLDLLDQLFQELHDNSLGKIK